MGKHDKVIQASSEEYLQNRVDDLTARLAFSEETIKKLQTQCARMSKWASEVEANAQDAVSEKDAQIALLKDKIAKLVELYV